MGKIHVLAKQVAELIAAGEVVERPASAVKEMLENAIDAGADAVTVEIKNGGVTFIRITDDGCGIERGDVAAAFQRHATSKVLTAEDLESIGTLGFRGEALASISAVSRCELLTRTDGELAGTRTVLEGGEVVEQGDAGCPRGTTIIVRDLFYNTPARMKFLKKDVSEGNAVSAVVERIALSHPEVSVRFIKDGKEELHTPGDNRLLSAIHAVFGRSFAEGMLPTDYEQQGVSLRGYVCAPAAARSNRSLQLFFLNGRYIRSKTAAAALEEAYRRSLMVGKYPACVLNLVVNPALVDVNVHPAKLEVRFANEKQIFDAVYYGVKNALGEGDHPPSLEFSGAPVQKGPEPTPQAVFNSGLNFSLQKASKEEEAEQTVFASALFNPIRAAYQPVQNPAVSGPVIVEKDPAVSPAEEAAPIREADMPRAENGTFVRPPVQGGVPHLPASPAGVPAPVVCTVLGECFHTYILAEHAGELWVIDKHAAHERILYENIRAKGEAAAQLLLSPVTVVLAREEYDAVLSHLDELRAAGFGVEDFGGSSVLVREAPMMVPPGEAAETLAQLAGDLARNKKETLPERVERIYHSVACRAAVKAGDHSTPAELTAIAARVIGRDDIRYCPHGRPVAVTLSKGDLEKQFGRA